MQVRKYRASTTREALEQIKEELGEDAFVLETKRLDTRGFLGLTSRPQIEISAMPARPEEDKPEASQSLSLADDTPASPAALADGKATENPVVSQTAIFPAKQMARAAKAGAAIQPSIQPVEIAAESPRLVHTKKESVRPAAAVKTGKSTALPVTSRDLELLRAELREVKFSLGAFASRQSQQLNTSIIDLEANGEIYDSPFYEAFIDLTATGISPELAWKFLQTAMPDFKNNLLGVEEFCRTALIRGLAENLKFKDDPLKKDTGAIMAVVGPTGVGKTTTIAKLAARVALSEKRKVELVTLDTYRIAAVEQLKTYAEIIGAGCHVVRSTLELDAMLRNLPDNRVILIDTTGKSPHDLADQYELCEYLQSRSDIAKCLTVQATTNVQDAISLIRKFKMYGADCIALTKMDETTRPGAFLEAAAEGGLPFAYLGIGQRVPEDLKTATPQNLAARILGESDFRATALLRQSNGFFKNSNSSVNIAKG